MNNHWRSKIYEPEDTYANEPGDLGSSALVAVSAFFLKLVVFASALAGLYAGFTFAEWWLS